MEKLTQAIGVIFLVLILGLLINIYETFVIMKIVTWYHVPLVLTFQQWFGSIAIIQIITLKARELVSNNKDKEGVRHSLEIHFVLAVLLSLLLGFYFIYSIFI